MRHFWDSLNRKRYLFNEIYDIDTTILRFQNWFTFEYDIDLERTFCTYYQTGDETFEEECISEEEYLSNLDSNYIIHVNYNDLTSRPDYNKICNEFETIINDAFIHQEQNVFLKFAQESIDQAQADGQAKSLLKSILQTLDIYSKKQATLLTDEALNRLQEIIAEAYSFSYCETLNTLIRRYDDIYEQITKPFKESKAEIKQHEVLKKHIHSQIFAGNAFYFWERLREHFKLSDTSRADFRFMYEAMKHDKYIHKTVKLTDMLNWVNDTYEITIGKPRFDDFKTDTKRMPIYNMLKLQHQTLDK